MKLKFNTKRNRLFRFSIATNNGLKNEIFKNVYKKQNIFNFKPKMYLSSCSLLLILFFIALGKKIDFDLMITYTEDLFEQFSSQNKFQLIKYYSWSLFLWQKTSEKLLWRFSANMWTKIINEMLRKFEERLSFCSKKMSLPSHENFWLTAEKHLKNISKSSIVCNETKTTLKSYFDANRCPIRI